jgi:hypothetical protein
VHRNYECLLVNSIPINIENTIKHLFNYHKLPGIFLQDWDRLDIKILCDQVYNFDNVDKFLKIKYHYGLLRGEV